MMLVVCCRVHVVVLGSVFLFFFKQKTAYEMRISDWSSDVCSSDLGRACAARQARRWLWVVAGRGWAAGFARGAASVERSRAGRASRGQLGRASCRARVCQYV